MACASGWTNNMRVAIIGNHNWPINCSATPPYTGDFFVALLCKGLDEAGHNVSFVAPQFSYRPPNGKLLQMHCAFGKYPPSAYECEQAAYLQHEDELKHCDVVCDFSTNKTIVEQLFSQGFNNVCSPILGGSWNHPNPRHNVICFSETQKQRGLKGQTDYFDTLFPEMGGPNQTPINDAVVIHAGIDTDFYTPSNKKHDFYLWTGRWHPIRGYKLAIDIAIKSGIKLILAGENPEEALMTHQKECAHDAMKLAAGHSNISFAWLPAADNHHSAKRSLIQNAKGILLTTQFQEPFGFSQVEALSCGTPVLSTNYGSMPEVLGDCGVLVGNDVDRFCNHLHILDHFKKSDLRERAVRLFDYKVMTANYIKTFEDILKGKSW